jgi:hypothetical protein
MDKLYFAKNDNTYKIKLPTELKKRFREKCTIHNISMNGVIIMLIKEFVNKEFDLLDQLDLTMIKKQLDEIEQKIEQLNNSNCPNNQMYN